MAIMANCERRDVRKSPHKSSKTGKQTEVFGELLKICGTIIIYTSEPYGWARSGEPRAPSRKPVLKLSRTSRERVYREVLRIFILSGGHGSGAIKEKYRRALNNQRPLIIFADKLPAIARYLARIIGRALKAKP